MTLAVRASLDVHYLYEVAGISFPWHSVRCYVQRKLTGVPRPSCSRAVRVAEAQRTTSEEYGDLEEVEHDGEKCHACTGRRIRVTREEDSQVVGR